jgi:hypothetical protein
MKKLLFLVTLFGFVACGQEPAAKRDTVTKQDLEKIRREVRQTRKAAEGVVKGQEDAARSAEKQSNGIRAAVEDGQKNIAAEVARQNAAIAAEAAKSRRTIWFVALSSVGLLAIGGTGFALWVRKGRNAKTGTEVIDAPANLDYVNRPGEARRLMKTPTSDVPTQRSIAELPENPRPNEIRRYAAANPNVSSFDVFFSSDGRRIKGTVKKDAAGVLSVVFSGYPKTTPCGVDKAYKTAMFLLSPAQLPEQEITN